MDKRILIVVSYYNSRPKLFLDNLIFELKKFNTDLALVINDDKILKVTTENNSNFFTVNRPNVGMNIGAWNECYQLYSNYDYYLFLQDECLILNNDFLEKYISELSKPNIGMTGESINLIWNRPWSVMQRSKLNYNIYIEAEKLNISRVNYYLSFLKKWNIKPGENAGHLRALIWGFNSQCLKKINEFPIGKNKDQCIAAEIAVSKKVQQYGFEISQIDSKPFKYISHNEWRLNGASKNNIM